ncbi:exodeoxyribonuclease VII small subunit [Streptomyces sp. ME19-01-6]|uniref:exodeoxyribonuclease VII small subunit n=1 Tax=Streptomyces sp. ME19-01-6 TaxID=3028686 RepID=UPI0029A74721|nr:exodeoxyribonuclease VII small subunit [Streptomyces sp. ME19-01-6]MDX3225857.1 exodeoxyribonuclease VII small subunit [Streptomyces sp. ME19-01-6]
MARTQEKDEKAEQAKAAGSPAEASTLGYEQARDELVEVVRRLEAGGTTLEESLALWERGEELAKVCRRWLEGARARLDAALAETAEGDEGKGDGGEGDSGS